MTLCLDSQSAQVHTQEKRMRFSLSYDAVSEAASNHSGTSSLDMKEDEEGKEDQQDNFSGMVSAKKQ